MAIYVFTGGTCAEDTRRVVLIRAAYGPARAIELWIRRDKPWRELRTQEMHAEYSCFGVIWGVAPRRWLVTAAEARSMATDAAKQDFDTTFSEIAGK